MKGRKKFAFKLLAVLLVLLVFQAPSFAKEYKSKTISKTLDARPNIEVLHKYGPLQIEASTDGKIHFEATLLFDAQSESEAQVVFDHFDISVREGGSELVLETLFDVKNWNQSFGTIKIRFTDGDRVKNISKLKINMTVKIPKSEYLKLKNKYDKIAIKNSLNTNLEVVLYEGTLDAKNINGDLELSLKYSKANIGNYKNATIQLYECSLHLGNGKNVKLNTKYSKFYMGSTNNFIIDAYEGKGEIGLIKGGLKLRSKYFKLSVDNFKNADISTYEGSFTAKSGENLTGQSKYGTITIQNINNINLESTYETDVEIGKIGSLTALDSKYSNFDIEELSGKIKAKTYEGHIYVQQITNSFEGVDFEGKYSNLKLNIPSRVKYRFEADLRYTNIDYDKDKFDTSVYIEKNDKISIKAKVSGATDNSPLITVVSYEGKISLE